MKKGDSHTLVHLGYWTAAVVFLVAGWALHQASRQGEESGRWVDHTLQVLALTGAINESMGRAEAANRGFVLFGAEDYIADRDAALSGMPGLTSQLAALLQDNPAQLERAGQLRRLLEERAVLMRGAEAARRASGSAEGARDRVAEGKAVGARVYALGDELRSGEARLLAERRRHHQEASDLEERVLLIALLIGLAVMLPSYLGFVRESRARSRIESSLRTLAESLPGAVFQYRGRGGEGRYEFITTRSNAVVGVEAAEVLRDPQAILKAIAEEDRPQVIAAFRRGEETMSTITVDCRLAGAGERWLRASASPRRSVEGELIWSGLWTDITERKSLTEQLRASRDAAEHANRAKSTFLATMSHEIRTPMNGVLGMLELLAHSPLQPDQRATLSVVRESARALLRIIDDILDFSKIEAGKLELRPEPASVAALVDRVRGFYAGNASSKGIALTSSLDERIRPVLLLDPVRVQQVLGNFVSNSIKFTSRGSVHVRAELLARVDDIDVVQFSVADTGIGVSATEMERLFEPFSQVREHASRPGGTGLGLSICKRLADLMGGSIEMRSQPGRGTTMYLTLRLERSTEDAVAPHPNLAAPAPPVFALEQAVPEAARALRSRTTILVVDDHPINRMVLERQVTALGYGVATAGNGVEALEAWRRGGYAAIVTDCNMPGMDGYQLTHRMRQAEVAEGRTPTVIIACTANAIAGEAEKCLEAGMDDYLAKPVELYRLDRKLAQWLPVSATGGPVDRAALASLARGDPALEMEALRRFLDCHEQDVRDLERGVLAGDFRGVVDASHRIKGSTRIIGAAGLASVCERIEYAGRSKDAHGVAAEMPLFDSENRRLRAYLGEILQ